MVFMGHPRLIICGVLHRSAPLHLGLPVLRTSHFMQLNRRLGVAGLVIFPSSSGTELEVEDCVLALGVAPTDDASQIRGKAPLSLQIRLSITGAKDTPYLIIML
jgi:hypothetical protein